MKRLLLALVLAVSLLAQAPATPTSVSTCPTYYTLGGTYNPSAAPRETGYAATSTVMPGIQCNPVIPQPRIYSQYIVTPTRVDGQWQLGYTTSTGAIYPLRSFGPITLWLLGNLGVTTSSDSAKLGTAFGGIATINIKRLGVTLTPGFEIVNGNKTPLFGVAKSF